MYDVLIIGAGPAAIALAASLAEANLHVGGLAPIDPAAPWPNTYGIWRDELDALNLAPLLAHRWTNSVAFADHRMFALDREYGLFDNGALKRYLLEKCAHGGMVWHTGAAERVEHTATRARVQIRTGEELLARVVVDASGHRPIFVQRPFEAAIAYQVAYGIVGIFSTPPVEPRQLMLMDYRNDHLPADERSGPPTFLYAMDLGEGRYFVEETSLAHVPALGYDLLERRLHQRLAWHDIQVLTTEHVEHCIFPMNMPLPYRNQPVLGYGGAASMVHPISGYQVGAALRKASAVAAALAEALRRRDASPAAVARAGWHALWPQAEVRKHALYFFGLQALLRFDAEELNRFFAAFFALPRPLWTGYLSDTLTQREVARAMLALFQQAPADIRSRLMQSARCDVRLLTQALTGL